MFEQEVINAIKDADAILAGTEPFTEKVLNSTNTLKVISRVGVGIDNIDLKTASEKGIKIYNTPTAPTQAVAEHTMALIFAIAKNIVNYNRLNSEANLKIKSGFLISGRTAGIIGLGRIGFTVAKLLFAAGCKIGFYDPYLSRKDIPDEWTQYSSINELLENSDIITLHMPPNPDATPIISKSSITHFKKGSVLINTARSSLVDENVLLKAVDEGVISAAGLDVYDSIIEDKIQKYPQIIITPHIASNTDESRKDMETEAIENLISAFTEN
ncbi:MAG: NAD(P)-dependent oxidoreductase [Methanomicrobium sp.]|nr:NAD(P)-dependent oxidoreductase [Methanomicrobium sp.]